MSSSLCLFRSPWRSTLASLLLSRCTIESYFKIDIREFKSEINLFQQTKRNFSIRRKYWRRWQRFSFDERKKERMSNVLNIVRSRVLSAFVTFRNAEIE